MRKLLLATAAAALALTGGTAVAKSPQERGEERLAKMIEGREAGEPQSCIYAFNSNDIEVIDYVGIVYERGDTVYVARARDPRSLSTWDVPVIKRHGSQLCNLDQIHTVDRSSGMFSGVVFLEPFVPYTRSEDQDG